MKTDDDPEGVGPDPNTQWERVAADLRAYRVAQRRAWGDLDEAAIARYLAAEATEEERSRVEQAMRDFPRVRECVETVREVMKGLGQDDRTECAGKETSYPIEPTPSKGGFFSRSSVRRLAPYALAACLLVAGGLVLMPKLGQEEPPRPPLVRENPVEAEPKIVAMKVDQYRREGDQAEPIGTIGDNSRSAREKDLVRVSARLDRPAYCYVIAFNPDGHDQLYYPRDRDVPPPRSAEIDYPVDDGYFHLTGGTGLQAFVLVASNEPLPSYQRWRSGLGEVPWQPTQADEVWRSDGRGLEPAMAMRSGTAAPSEPPRALSQLHRFLATRPGAGAVGVLAFPVKPGAEGTPPKPDREGR
jgi:hypothetical protein